MKLTVRLSIIYLFFMTNCQLTSSQERGEGLIKIIIDKDIEFVDCDVDTVTQAFVFAHVYFYDSLPLKPDSVSITRFGMREIDQDDRKCNIRFHISFFDSYEDSLNTCERKLLEKYLPKVDSIYMNSLYEFEGENGYARRMGIGFTFKINPK